MPNEDQIVWTVIEEHLDEAEFLVELWAGARRSGSYTLGELERGPETRLAAHVDGLVVNGPLALERVAWPVIEDPKAELFRVAAAALAVLDGGDFRVLAALDDPKKDEAPEPDEPGEDDEAEVDEPLPPEWAELGPEERERKRQADLEDVEQQLAATEDEDERKRLLELQELLQADPPDPDEAAEATEGAAADEGAEPVAAEADPRIEGLALALAWSSHPQLGEQLRARAAKADGPSLALLLGACADRGMHPGPALERGLAHDDPQVRSAALRAAAFGDRPKLLATVEAQLQHRSPAVRAAALDIGLIWGSRAAWELALQIYKTPAAANARLWVACLGDDRHVEALVPLLADPVLRPDVLWALGFCGRVPAILACMKLLDDADETTRRLAGEAVAAILGLDVEDETLWEQPDAAPAVGAQGDVPEQDADDLDAELAPTPVDELPLPNAVAIRERWAKQQSAFVPGRRYLLGKPVEREGPGWALSLLSCRRIDVVAREVAARSQGVGRWPGRARAGRHQQAASALAELGRQAGAIQGDRR
jgi:uncharacterized protein (TIGR02270 family)